MKPVSRQIGKQHPFTSAERVGDSVPESVLSALGMSEQLDRPALRESGDNGHVLEQDRHDEAVQYAHVEEGGHSYMDCMRVESSASCGSRTDPLSGESSAAATHALPTMQQVDALLERIEEVLLHYIGLDLLTEGENEMIELGVLRQTLAVGMPLDDRELERYWRASEVWNSRHDRMREGCAGASPGRSCCDRAKRTLADMERELTVLRKQALSRHASVAAADAGDIRHLRVAREARLDLGRLARWQEEIDAAMTVSVSMRGSEVPSIRYRRGDLAMRSIDLKKLRRRISIWTRIYAE